MKIAAYLANVAFIIFLTCLWAMSNAPTTGKDILIWFLFFLYAVANILALWLASEHRGFLSLYFERKRLEQEIKIDQLRKQAGKQI